MEGYDAKFDPPLDKRLECPICLLAQREPMQTPCGHRFCSACILRALSETGTRCPVDNTRVAVHQLFKDNFAKREVLSLHVHCHAEEHGCPWEGELRNLELHEKHCELVTITCPNECGYVCQRRRMMVHLPVCSNHICPCTTCSISYPQNKLMEHAQFCSRTKVPDSIVENIAKSNEVLKWCGQLKMKVHGQNYSALGYLTAKVDSEERFIYSGCWSNNINLIPLMGAASKLFWKTLQGPEVKPVELYFGILNSDTKSNNFHKMLKKKVNAVIGLRLKPSSRRELMIMYIHWSDSQKRLIAYVAELRNYLVREMQRKLQPLRRSANLGQLSENMHSRSSERGSSSRRGYSGSVRVINVPPTIPAASIENHSHAPPVVPSILSWQLSPSFPAYPWRVQAGGPSVPFFTIPSTPPQFLPAHSYPYTFAPMPAIAAPPFSINPIQPVPAPLTVPSYAGVSVPQVSGLHAELVVSSANNSAMQGPGSFIEGAGNNPPMPHLTAGAVIHPYAAHTTQDPTLAMPPGPPHPVNQVSVVVDPRLNPQGVTVAAESRHDGRQRQNEQGRWVHHPPVNATNRADGHSGPGNRSQSSTRGVELLPESSGGSSIDSLFRVITSDNRYSGNSNGSSSNAAGGSSSQRRAVLSSAGPHSHANMPGPSGLQQQNSSSSSSSSSNNTSNNHHQQQPPTHSSAAVQQQSASDDHTTPSTNSSRLSPETSDDDSDIDSPFHWSLASSASSNSPHHIQYIDPPNDYMFSESGSPSTRGSGDEGNENSPMSSQRAIGSALQTLADAAALLSSSPQSDSNSSDDAELGAMNTTQPLSHNNGGNRSSSTSSTSTVPSVTTSTSSRSDQVILHQQQETAAAIYSSLPSNAPVHPSLYHQQNHNGVLTITQQGQPSVYNNIHPSQLATAPPGYHPAAHLEELPVFVPVIHPSVDQLEAATESVNPIAPTGEGTAVLYAPHESAGMVVTSRPLPMADVPPLIRIAAQNQRNMMPPPEQWPIVEQRTSQQLPPPPPPPAGFIRPQPVMAAAGPPGGGFWEDVMPSLDMRLHETHTSLI